MPWHRLAHALGYELLPRHKLRLPAAQTAAALARHTIDLVVDVGAHRGRWSLGLRAAGWRGPILLVEPQAELHPELARLAGRDGAMRLAPPMALGAADGTATLEVSAEPDMSSLRPQLAAFAQRSPTSVTRERRAVPLHRLDGLGALLGTASRIFVKVDVQGAEADVLAGAEGLWPRIVGVQVETGLVASYAGESLWPAMASWLAARSLEPWLVFPGYFDRQQARHLQLDLVAFRPLPGA